MSEPEHGQRGIPATPAARDALVARRCHRLLDEVGADGVSVSVRTGGEIGDLIHATDAVSVALEELQAVLGVGPAHDAYRTNMVVEVDDTNSPSALGRWPGFAHEAAGSGAAALLVVPLNVRGKVFGHIELYRRTPVAITVTPSAAELITDLGDSVLALFDGDPDVAERGAGRQNGRPDLHVAAGIVSVQLGVSISDALARMCATAFGEHRTLQRLSHDIVTGDRRFDVRDTDG